jgi:hypothetical protein
MKPFDVYKTYLALKNHLTKESYDYHKYAGKVSASAKSFDTRRDRYHFEKLAKKRDPFGFMLANLLVDPKVWVGELTTNDNAETVYRSWAKRNQSLSYTFKEEVNKLSETYQSFDEMFRAGDGRHPPLLREYLRQSISLETLVILVHLSGCYNYWNRKMDFDPVWQEVALKIRKYHPFMQYDAKKLRDIVIDIYGD